MSVIIYTDRGITRSYVQGADGQGGLSWTEDQSNALQFVDGAAATAFSSGKNIVGGTQLTVTGRVHKGMKSANQ